MMMHCLHSCMQMGRVTNVLTFIQVDSLGFLASHLVNSDVNFPR